MAKRKSKKSSPNGTTSFGTPSLNLLCNLNGGVGINEFESCLEELSQEQNYNIVEKEEEKEKQTFYKEKDPEYNNVSDDSQEKLWDPSVNKPKISSLISQRLMKNENVTQNRIPNIQLEMARHLQMKNLSTFLLQSCPNLRMPAFERWLIDSKLEEKNKRARQMQLQNRSRKLGKQDKKKRNRFSEMNEHVSTKNIIWWDPVIPSCPEVSDSSCERLIYEIEMSSKHENTKKSLDARSICMELCSKSADAANKIYLMSQRVGLYQNITSSKTGEKVILEKQIPLKEQNEDELPGTEQTCEPSLSTYSLIYNRKKLKKPFVIKINASHYDKLWNMFMKQMKTLPNSDSKKSKHAFHSILFTILLRYSSLSGGQLLQDLRGGGMQGAIHTQVFQYLRAKLDCRMECFASPLNVYFGNFCSAFEEEVLFFGSSGSFFDMKLLEGCFEANPPFAPGLMREMIDRMNRHLDAAKENDSSLTFVIIVPTCPMSDTDDLVQRFARESFAMMLHSPYFVHHSIMKARDHGYIEAAQHLRPTRFKQSQYDTSVIVLQSKRLNDNNGPTWWSDFERGLIQAFSSRHEQETKERLEKNDDIKHQADEEQEEEVNLSSQEQLSFSRHRKKRRVS